MTSFIRVKIVDETNEENPVVVWQHDFPTIDRFNQEIENALYSKVLEYNALYDFIDYYNCPDYQIYYIKVTKSKEEIIYRDDCVNYMHNL